MEGEPTATDATASTGSNTGRAGDQSDDAIWDKGDYISDLLDVRNSIGSGSVHSWTVLEPMRYTTAYLKAGPGQDARQVIFTVPENAQTDFASIPRPLWWFAAPWGRHGRAGIFHDYAYRKGYVEASNGDDNHRVAVARNEADYLFFSAMLTLDDAYDGRPAEPVDGVKAKGVRSSVITWPLRRGMEIVRLIMTLAVVAFGWTAYRGDTRNRATGLAAAASTFFAIIGLVAFGWWLVDRLLGDLAKFGYIDAAGSVAIAGLAIALATARFTVHLGQKSLRSRLAKAFGPAEGEPCTDVRGSLAARPGHNALEATSDGPGRSRGQTEEHTCGHE